MPHPLTRILMVAGLATSVASPLAFADDLTVQWKNVLEILQVNNVVGSGTGAVTGGGQPWSTLGGNAAVDLQNGRVTFEVRGLVFAGGNAIGTPGAVTQVKGTLVCGTDGSAGGGNSVLVDTPLVPLDEEGDARFNGTLGALPAVCATETDIAFLVRIGAGRWIANGSVLR